MCAEKRLQGGFTLVEIIVAMVLIGIALAGVLSVFIVTTRSSADPMQRQQTLLIAEAYLEEILPKRFYDPDTSNVCPAAEGSRSSYDNVCDYNSLNQAPTDQFGNAIAGLSGYNVQVAVTRDGTVNLNGLTNGPAANEIRVLRVDVTVTAPNGESMTQSGYRTNYNCNVSTDAECKGP
jgi:MSHA pilin protein MshD